MAKPTVDGPFDWARQITILNERDHFETRARIAEGATDGDPDVHGGGRGLLLSIFVLCLSLAALLNAVLR